MRRIFVIFLLLLLTGCSASNSQMDRALQIRNQVLTSNGCEFRAQITADYGELIYQFTLRCVTDNQGAVTFTVEAPESIAGITGTLSAEGGKLTYDGTVLAFDLLAQGTLSPVSSPWLLIKTLRGGYISSGTVVNDQLMLVVDDSYAQDALKLNIWFDQEDKPVRAEVFWEEACVLTMEISDFNYL